MTPELPHAYVDTAYVEPTGVHLQVSDGGDLQAALDMAQSGDVVELPAGSVFTGNFKLGEKYGWVYVTTAGCDIKPNNRATPTDAWKMARVQTATDQPVFTTLPRASFWRFMCLEITNSRDDVDVTNLVQLQPGNLTATVTTLEDFPHHIIFDRVLLHGNPGDRVRRAMRQGGANQAVINSSCYDIRMPGFDTQCISDSQGPGPYKIVNNYLEATTENVAYGGSNPRFQGVFPSDIEIRGNYVYKSLAWKDIPADPIRGSILVKNLIEFKAGRRVLIEGNVFENNWVNAQVGFAVVMTPQFAGNLTNPDGTPLNAIEDITFRNNKILNSPLAINLLGTGVAIAPTGMRSPSRRQAYLNNYWQLTGSGGGGRLLQINNRATEVEFTGNTFEAPADCKGTALHIGSGASVDMVFRNNIMPWCTYGVYSTVSLTDRAKWEAAFTPGDTLDARFNGNQFVKDRVFFLPPGNTFLPFFRDFIATTDMGAIDSATAHVIDGQTESTGENTQQQ